MIKDDKDKIIDMIRHLRTKIGNLVNNKNEDDIEETQKYLNSIQDKVFSL